MKISLTSEHIDEACEKIMVATEREEAVVANCYGPTCRRQQGKNAAVAPASVYICRQQQQLLLFARATSAALQRHRNQRPAKEANGNIKYER